MKSHDIEEVECIMNERRENVLFTLYFELRKLKIL